MGSILGIISPKATECIRESLIWRRFIFNLNSLGPKVPTIRPKATEFIMELQS